MTDQSGPTPVAVGTTIFFILPLFYKQKVDEEKMTQHLSFVHLDSLNLVSLCCDAWEILE